MLWQTSRSSLVQVSSGTAAFVLPSTTKRQPVYHVLVANIQRCSIPAAIFATKEYVDAKLAAVLALSAIRAQTRTPSLGSVSCISALKTTRCTSEADGQASKFRQSLQRSFRQHLCSSWCRRLGGQRPKAGKSQQQIFLSWYDTLDGVQQVKRAALMTFGKGFRRWFGQCKTKAVDPYCIFRPGHGRQFGCSGSLGFEFYQSGGNLKGCNLFAQGRQRVQKARDKRLLGLTATAI